MYGPILLTQGVNPMVVAATLLYFCIFSSGASMFMFLVFGKLPWIYTLWIALFCGAGATLGLLVMTKAIKKYKRPSLVAFALSLAIMFSNIMSIYAGTTTLIDKAGSDIDIMRGDPIC